MNRVRELRIRAGLQQKELAILAGVSHPTVSDWETGKKNPSGERLKKLSHIFGVDNTTILGYDAARIVAAIRGISRKNGSFQSNSGNGSKPFARITGHGQRS